MNELKRITHKGNYYSVVDAPITDGDYIYARHTGDIDRCVARFDDGTCVVQLASGMRASLLTALYYKCVWAGNQVPYDRRTIRDFMSEPRNEIAMGFSDLLADMRATFPVDGTPDEQRLYAMQVLAKVTAAIIDIYTQGYNDCLSRLDQADPNFLNRKLPARLKA